MRALADTPIPYALSHSASLDCTVHLSGGDLDRLALLGGAWEETERRHTGWPAQPTPGALCTALARRALRQHTPQELADQLWTIFVG